jgi:subtilisin family serine protease
LSFRGAAAAAILAAAVSLVAAASPTRSATLSPKLRPDLAALVSGESQLDARIPPLVGGYVPGEIPYFAVLSESNDAAHAAQITALGGRILRTYSSISAFAVASSPAVVQGLAALPWVTWLAPIEIVTALDDAALADQTRGTPADVGASALWSQGLTGSGVKIAVLDTGIDPTHPDLDDLDFHRWSQPLNPGKVIAAQNFVGSTCSPTDTQDRNGHGTHVSGIASGTGEGASADDPHGRYVGVAPDATLVVGKVFTDGGVGINSDLIAAMEWASLPAGTIVRSCPGGVTTAVGASIVNMSLGSEARPQRLNTASDVDAVSVALNALAVGNGTLFVASAGNSGPYIGSLLEAPGAAPQALSVSAAAKDYDLNHDDTASGNTCAGWSRASSSAPADNTCAGEAANQPSSLSAFSSRGPAGDVWLRPDLAAPGYDIVSAEAASGAVVHSLDIAPNTVDDPLYATVSGTSMAAPATSGSAALLLQSYRTAYGSDPSGGSGVSGLRAPAYVLLRAAFMNTATSAMYEARMVATQLGVSANYYEARNIGPADPYVGPAGEGAGKLSIGRAIAALRDGAVIYSAASGSGGSAGTGHRDFQGTWQVGAIAAGAQQTQRFVLHAAPNAGPLTATFSFLSGHPSDSAGAVVPAKKSWTVGLPAKTKVARGGEALVSFTLGVPAGAAPGNYTGAVLVSLSNGQILHVPVFAAVVLHDTNTTAGNATAPQARIASARDVYAKDDTVWPSAAGQALGATADWLVFPMQLGSGLSQARLHVYDSDRGDETYDVYVYDSSYNLYATTHPFSAPGVTDVNANSARGPSTQNSPPLTLSSPAAGTYYVVVNRARIGGMTSGDFGSFVLTLDEIR